MPEDLPTAESIRGELERQRRARQKIQIDKTLAKSHRFPYNGALVSHYVHLW